MSGTRAPGSGTRWASRAAMGRPGGCPEAIGPDANVHLAPSLRDAAGGRGVVGRGAGTVGGGDA